MLVSIIGNNASGKTSLAAALGREPGIKAYLESHEDRPYQALFAEEPQRYALHNQIDYLMARAEQEAEIRTDGGIGVQDGGLDQDFFLYTRLFHHKGFLDEKEYALCRRVYLMLRNRFPEPDVFVYLSAPLDLLKSRLEQRGREIDLKTITTLKDLPILQGFLDSWAAGISPLMVSAEDLDLGSAGSVQQVAAQLREIFTRKQDLG